MDDWLTERSQSCLLCGKRARWHDVRAGAGQACFVGLCARCATAQGWRAVE